MKVVATEKAPKALTAIFGRGTYTPVYCTRQDRLQLIRAVNDVTATDD